jgi:hypothetical protein
MTPYTETHAVVDDYGQQLYTVTTVQDYDPPARTVAELTAQVDDINRARAEMAAQLRELSARMQAVQP